MEQKLEGRERVGTGGGEWGKQRLGGGEEGQKLGERGEWGQAEAGRGRGPGREQAQAGGKQLTSPQHLHPHCLPSCSSGRDGLKRAFL